VPRPRAAPMLSLPSSSGIWTWWRLSRNAWPRPGPHAWTSELSLLAPSSRSPCTEPSSPVCWTSCRKLPGPASSGPSRFRAGGCPLARALAGDHPRSLQRPHPPCLRQAHPPLRRRLHPRPLRGEERTRGTPSDRSPPVRAARPDHPAHPRRYPRPLPVRSGDRALPRSIHRGHRTLGTGREAAPSRSGRMPQRHTREE
jgi:hypothetical protein